MGYSIRTSDWRLTVWLPFNNTVFVAEWEAPPIAIELYDHRSAQVVLHFDADGEHENVASKPENAAVITDLMRQLKAPLTLALWKFVISMPCGAATIFASGQPLPTLPAYCQVTV